MCPPAIAAAGTWLGSSAGVATMMGLTAASTGYSLYTQRSQARASQRMHNANAKATAEQSWRQNSAKADDIARRGRAERARLTALTAESGLTGITTSSVVRNATMQASQGIGLTRQNLRGSLEANRFQHWSNLNSIQQPDYIGAGLNLGLNLTRQAQYSNRPDGD